MRDGTRREKPQPVGRRDVPDHEVRSAAVGHRAADYHHWLAQSADREHVRQDRIHSASAVGLPSLWIVLLFISAIVFAYMLFFADPSEGAQKDSRPPRSRS